ncbi:hypothetical protein ACQKMI_10645 [Lysinibacillus sp. NPDC097214]|uniref:hypothetical protein n=1 Tax=Lysinibacillus sp. NPDC097214 TaxID=3390584 RepID=UPI003D0200F9
MSLNKNSLILIEHIADLAKEYDIRKLDIEGYKDKNFHTVLYELKEIEDEETLIETGLLLFGTTFIDLHELVTTGSSLLKMFIEGEFNDVSIKD